MREISQIDLLALPIRIPVYLRTRFCNLDRWPGFGCLILLAGCFGGSITGSAFTGSSFLTFTTPVPGRFDAMGTSIGTDAENVVGSTSSQS